MLYPLSYWSILIAAPPTRSHGDSKIIAAERARLKRVRQTYAFARAMKSHAARPKLYPPHSPHCNGGRLERGVEPAY